MKPAMQMPMSMSSMPMSSTMPGAMPVATMMPMMCHMTCAMTDKGMKCTMLPAEGTSMEMMKSMCFDAHGDDGPAARRWA